MQFLELASDGDQSSCTAVQMLLVCYTLLEEIADCILTGTGQEEVGSCNSHQQAVLSAVDQLQIVNAVGSCMLGASMETENLLVLCC
ncbi:hypothetical protein BDL97_12G050300 [Sphagnum fallax]|nr:hypothetical protein BDL97_12G050300 [Sphagnum fallax]KAH8945634.1 hypothetical protein BDL97_12G050300 [Sphagnum fallax]KAH8945635.1 hypothetical protein BDL97_12G050300 [Sphagnum fallax]KAH8945636.1 hypothetical protein BDL97_12G050300 [Sphagnum fallax]KAH8945637.1 hypothetical protein BDL97_12G050300 [Sphagnum fallax]